MRERGRKRGERMCARRAAPRRTHSVPVGPIETDVMRSYSPMVLDLLNRGFRLLLYEGQLDVRDGVAATEAWLPELSPWSGYDAWMASPRRGWCDWDGGAPGSVAGYVRARGRMTYVTVNGAGHLVPMDQAKRSEQMIIAWVRGEDQAYCH